MRRGGGGVGTGTGTAKSMRKRLSKLMRCAKGMFAKGILGFTGFSVLRWEKGLRLSIAVGEEGLRLPCSLGRSMRNEGVSDPFPHCKRESQTLFFPPQKGKPRTSPNP